MTWFVLLTIAPLVIIALMIVGFMKLLQKNNDHARQLSAQEERALLELSAGLERLEKRVQNLETILTAETTPAGESRA